MSAEASVTVSFGTRLGDAFERHGQLCVGIDPHAYLLETWGLSDSAESLREFGLRVVDAAAGQVGIIKPQVAFFERFGSAGYVALEQVIGAARDAGLLVIADVKRGDLGSSVQAYGQAWLTPGSPLEVDAMTISAFQGVGSIQEPMRLAESSGKGLFVLAATSNPEALDLQTAIISAGMHAGESVASSIVMSVREWNTAQGSEGLVAKPAEGSTPAARSLSRMGSIGVVIGATVDLARYAIDIGRSSKTPATPILAPGFGHQGARFSQLGALYGDASPYTVVSASRSILKNGPGALGEAIRVQAAEVQSCRA